MKGTQSRLYVKRPIPIRAFRWNGNPNTVRKNVSPADFTNYFVLGRDTKGYTLSINSMEGSERCKYGDYVIRGVNGEYYSCDHDIFLKTYKLASKGTD